MIAFAGLGANLGDRLQNLQAAIEEMDGLKGVTKVLRRSSFFETEPVGDFSSQPFYLNAAIQLETALSPRALLMEFLAIEKRHGRVRTALNAPRVLDIDLLFYGSGIIEEEGLRVPHPRLHLRRFVLIPLAEIAPGWVHPVSLKTIAELLKINHSAEKVERFRPSDLWIGRSIRPVNRSNLRPEDRMDQSILSTSETVEPETGRLDLPGSMRWERSDER
jgi:2-amino-4-hydroxy-6-hydroxymethyldihydropteridine diphosphokinase